MAADVAEDERDPAPQPDPEAVTVLMLLRWSAGGDAASAVTVYDRLGCPELPGDDEHRPFPLAVRVKHPQHNRLATKSDEPLE